MVPLCQMNLEPGSFLEVLTLQSLREIVVELIDVFDLGMIVLCACLNQHIGKELHRFPNVIDVLYRGSEQFLFRGVIGSRSAVSSNGFLDINHREFPSFLIKRYSYPPKRSRRDLSEDLQWYVWDQFRQW